MSRVITKLFVPGHPDGQGDRQVSAVVTRVLGLDDRAVADGLAELHARFGSRHRELATVFAGHADRILGRTPMGDALSLERHLLLGATFTHEYSVEAAALCNPSIVVAPAGDHLDDGAARFVLSVRQIGEGHCSSIGFRTATVDRNGHVAVEEPGPFTTAGVVSDSPLHATTFQGLALREPDDHEATAWVLDALGDAFSHGELRARLIELEEQADTRHHVVSTIQRLRELAGRVYRVDFDASSRLDERILYPVNAVERNGIEDARFVQFKDESGERYYATYTAYDGHDITMQLLETTDFSSFKSSPLQGPAAQNKGLALFPRKINGRFAALSRHDGSTNAIAFSTDVNHWPEAMPIASRTALANTIQVGNCGSPIETDAGWLVLTHSVGPMRTYSIDALLLDLDDPTVVLGELPGHMLTPSPDEQDGYVPNVVYTCGAVVHRGNLVIPYGIGDVSIGFATARLDDVLEAMTNTST